VSQATANSSGYVDVGGGLEMYYERRGEGTPLVLLHGAFGTIESCFAELLPMLARRFEVIAIELQGHGRTRDVDRLLSYPAMARDTAALVDALGIQRAHLVGYSMGGAVALQVALDRPELGERLVWAGGASFDPWQLAKATARHSVRSLPLRQQPTSQRLRSGRHVRKPT
jgi:pimeloyl-ACP methyl ester carboxylesterase